MTLMATIAMAQLYYIRDQIKANYRQVRRGISIGASFSFAAFRTRHGNFSTGVKCKN